MVNIYLVIQNPLKKINYEETPSFYFNDLLILITTYTTYIGTYLIIMSKLVIKKTWKIVIIL